MLGSGSERSERSVCDTWSEARHGYLCQFSYVLCTPDFSTSRFLPSFHLILRSNDSSPTRQETLQQAVVANLFPCLFLFIFLSFFLSLHVMQTHFSTPLPLLVSPVLSSQTQPSLCDSIIIFTATLLSPRLSVRNSVPHRASEKI